LYETLCATINKPALNPEIYTLMEENNYMSICWTMQKKHKMLFTHCDVLPSYPRFK